MSERIECKPTQWFLLRAAAMLLMFGIFTVLFYKDGSTGYREKNISYYTWRAVEQAAAEFGELQSKMTPEEWREHVAGKTLDLPEDRSILPEGTPETLPWPELLGDYEVMKEGLGNPKKLLFDRYRDEVGMKHDAGDKAFTAGKIFEQWVVFWICLALSLGAVFVLLRTISRKMVLDGSTFQPAGGKAVDLADLVRLDLRRWDGKGLAFAWAKTDGGAERKIRIDGLTYGGFKKEDGEPAEKLMQALRAGFSGELIEYVSEEEPSEAPKTSES
ncbi:MAG: hypothetical protein ACPG4K_06615 [Haloferula sp.]